MNDETKPELKPGQFLDPTRDDLFETQEDLDHFERLLEEEKRKVAQLAKKEPEDSQGS